MLQKIHRLTKQSDFKTVFTKGKKVVSKFFLIYFLKTESKNTRVAIIVSNKVSKKAVIRNKLKRQMREIVKKFISDLNHDIIVSANPLAVGLSFSELAEDLSSGLKKII